MGKPRTLKGRAVAIYSLLVKDYPGDPVATLCELDHTTPFELLIATILSAQCTDARVNLVTPALFAKYPIPQDLADADRDELEEMIRTTGFFRNKANSLLGMAAKLVSEHSSLVPGTMEDLVALPGVGRKTANVVRSVALDLPGLPVDTHVGRVVRRLGLTVEEDPVKVEHALGNLLAPKDWGGFSLRIILHGRRVCAARKPTCGACSLAELCPSAGSV